MALAATNVQRSCVVLAAIAAAHGASAQVLQFSDRTAQAGLTAVNTVAPPPVSETWLMTGGAAVGDFNNDGWQDVFVLGGPGAPDKLYINNHDGTFTDQAAAWGVAATHWGVGVAVGDFNNDGWLDIYVTSWGTDGYSCQHKLYRNNKNGTFTDVAEIAGVQSTCNSLYVADGFGTAFGDYDLDGHLDLAVAGWLPGTGSNRLFHNNGDGTFNDTTAALNLDMTNEHGYSPRFLDMNGDGYPELLWVGDFGTSVYFINNKDGTSRPRPRRPASGSKATAWARLSVISTTTACRIGTSHPSTCPTAAWDTSPAPATCSTSTRAITTSPKSARPLA